MVWVMTVACWENIFPGTTIGERQMRSMMDLRIKKQMARSPSHSYIPRFRNVRKQEMDFLRGYAIGLAAEEEPKRIHR